MKIYNFLRYSLPLFFKHELWRNKPLWPLSRLLYLHLLFALGVERYEYSWINGLVLPIERGETGLTGNFYFGLHEFNDMAFMINLLREDEIFVDIGSNLGSYSLLASGVANAKSIAFEPVPSTFQRLIENIEINNLENRISAKMIALTSPEKLSQQRSLFFSTDKDTENSFVDKNYGGQKISTAVSTLDLQCKNIDLILIKIDVEGHEPALLKGSINTLKSTGLLALIIENQSREVCDFLEHLNFIAVSYQGLRREVALLKKPDTNQIWVKREKLPEVLMRIHEAPKNYVLGQAF